MTEFIADEPVDQYLDELFDRLSGTGAAGRRSMIDAEDHLREAVAALPARRVEWCRRRTRSLG